jgi:HAD superfamily hydrolase (TIGR01509 family)
VTAALPARIDAVLFDWGDTLFHSPPGDRVLAEAAREQGVTLEQQAAREVWDSLWAAGKSPEELAKGRDLSAEAHRRVWTSLFTRAEALVPGVAALLYERVMDPEKWLPYRDTLPTLTALRERGVGIGVVSNVPRELRSVFERHGLRDLVNVFIHSYDHGAQKPDQTLFRAACDALGVAPGNALMVGDDPVADGGAVNAGLQVYVLPPASLNADGDRGLMEAVRLVESARAGRTG